MLVQEPVETAIWHCLNHYAYNDATFLAERLEFRLLSNFATIFNCNYVPALHLSINLKHLKTRGSWTKSDKDNFPTYAFWTLASGNLTLPPPFLSILYIHLNCDNGYYWTWAAP